MTDELSPRWDLTNVFPSLDSPAYQGSFQELNSQVDSLSIYFSEQIFNTSISTEPAALAEIISELIERVNAILKISSTLRAYISSFVSTDSFNLQARKLHSELEQVQVRQQQVMTRIKSWIGGIASTLPAVIPLSQKAQEHAFFLAETVEQSHYLMSEAEESLAAELNLSGANAWGKLQGTVTSQLSVEFELDGKVKTLPMPALINLHSHEDESVRRRAYEIEIKAWEAVREPLAAAMNGIKGSVNTLNRRRGRIDALHSALDSARIDRETLNAMMGAMKESFPMFLQYFQTKAALLGKEKLAWWDLFAPMGKSQTRFSFAKAREFILEHFHTFSPELSSFAFRAFKNHWIDAEQRVGKRGGAFCMSLPLVKESRILCNFDGSLSQVFTVAHELGHAFHNDCMFKNVKTELQRSTPMTMAETASIMCETIIFNAALANAANPEEELYILETSLIGSSQVIVDIYSRFLFESEVFERRAKSELSADDFCEIMERAQRETYGEGVDDQYLHKYMWTWKPHYYSAGLSFYNFPYAFGLLFGTGLYAICQQQGASFIPDYIQLLASTGEGMSADLAARFGIDIRRSEFWQSSLGLIGKRIERYKEL
jgi:oligoendopeptidase F